MANNNIKLSGNQTIPSGEEAPLTFETEAFDESGLHSTEPLRPSGVKRFVAPQDGVYEVRRGGELVRVELKRGESVDVEPDRGEV